MSDAYLAKPDRAFVQQLVELGGDSLKKCYQCATCSVTCTLSPADHPFPRKEMIWAQWGLKDKLLGNPDVWLCHRCADCSVNCPRGASPGDVMAAVRDASVQHYAFPSFMGKAVARPAMLPVLLAVPAVLMLLVLAAVGHLNIPAGEVEYGHFFPHLPLQLFFGGFIGLAIVAAVVGAVRFWRDMSRFHPPASKGDGAESIWPSVWLVARNILTHKHFKQCGEDRSRYYSHLLTFYGFMGLFVVTVGVVVAAYLFDYYPIPVWHPLKIVGNLSTIAMGVGLGWIIVDRLKKPAETEGSTARDWTFIGLLSTVVVTGFFVEVLRFADVAAVAYPLYFIHLVFVFGVLMYLPYSRFAHLVYRTVALVYAKHTGRELAGEKTAEQLADDHAGKPAPAAAQGASAA